MMKVPATTWIRPLLAVFCVFTLCATVIMNITAPEWFLVTTTTIISFYFGHVNGTAEKNTTTAGDIAITALRNSLANQPQQPANSTRTVTTEPDSSSVSVTTTNKGVV